MWQVLPPYLIKIHKNCRNGKKYFAPKSNVIKFEMCDAMMLLPQSEQGKEQLSGSKDDWKDNVKWDSIEDESC